MLRHALLGVKTVVRPVAMVAITGCSEGTVAAEDCINSNQMRPRDQYRNQEGRERWSTNSKVLAPSFLLYPRPPNITCKVDLALVRAFAFVR